MGENQVECSGRVVRLGLHRTLYGTSDPGASAACQDNYIYFTWPVCPYLNRLFDVCCA
jgi:hypothetical protein